MITNALLERPWLSPTFLVIVTVVGPVAGCWLVGRSRWLWSLLGASLGPVVALTLIPVDRDLVDRCVVQWSLPTPGRVELFANLVLFVVPVLLAGILTGRPWLMFAAGSTLSALVEAVQAAVPSIGRSCDTTDWLSNTLGAGWGSLLAVGALALASRRRTRSRSGPTLGP